MTPQHREPLVLLAEDDDDLRELVASHLRREGMRVVEVEDGFELGDYLALCRPGSEVREPDVVVTDIRMPGESGPEALLHSHFHHSPVVLITAHLDAEARAYAARVGVVAIFEKPFELNELVGTIRKLATGAPLPPLDAAKQRR